MQTKNIFRLSLFNLRKNRREAVGIVVLTLITAFLLSTVAANITGISDAFDKSFEESGSKDGAIVIQKNYRDEHLAVLNEFDGVKDITVSKPLLLVSGMVIDSDGNGKSSYSLLFMTETEDRGFEGFVKGHSLSEDEIAALEHPIWLPEYFEITAKFAPGDTFTVLNGGKQYPFTIAGFYNAGLFSNTGMGFTCIITEDDKLSLAPVTEEYTALMFNRDAENNFTWHEYDKLCSERTGESFLAWSVSRISLKNNVLQFLNIFLYFSGALSLVTLAASLFMIRHKISKDIEDQMQQIGVLEALGYTSLEISLSYVYEYVITGGIGAVGGGIAAVMFTPVMKFMTVSMMSRTVHNKTNFAAIIIVTVLTVLAVILFALAKAGVIKKFPPVVAFRRGIKTHHFGKNFFPLERLKKSINLRLALKGIFTDMRSNLGVGLCIMLAGTAMLFSSYMFDFFKNGSDNLGKMMGCEIADTKIDLMDSADADKMREELLAMPEVRKVLPTADWLQQLKVKGSELPDPRAVVYDFNETENIFLIDGRFPQYDNEVTISLRRHREDNVNIGDSIIVQGDCKETSYIVTGIVSNLAFNQTSLYFTPEGFLRTNPTASLRVLDVYLNDGYSREDFDKKLTALYGANVEDTMAQSSEGSSLEERIRRKADEKMAVLISQYGVTDADYAIRIGDTLIKGNSSKFVIKKLSSLLDMAKTECDGIAAVTKIFSLCAMIFIAAVVAVILGIITSSNIKRQRKELGIMKSMGYSSRDLMTQTALRIMPVTVIAVVIAAVVSVIINKYFWMLLFGGQVPQNYALTVFAGIAIVIFTYIVTYIGASDIRKVSVTELMTE